MRLFISLLLLVSAGSVLFQGLVPCDVLSTSPDCFVAVRPGPVRDVLDLVEVTDEPTSESTGDLLLTTVLVQQDLTLRQLWQLRGDPTSVRSEKSLYFPDDVDEEVTRQQFAAMMQESEQTALVAALTHLGYDLDSDGVEVQSVLEGGPSDGVIETGDVIVGADGTSTLDADTLAEIVGALAPGDDLVLDLESPDGGTEQRTVTIGEHPDDPERGFVGLFLVTRIAIPVDIDIDAGGIGGPSAGMMFALTIVDLLTDEDLTGGRIIAGTGEITYDGRVGAIGGIAQKVAGAIDRSDDGPAAEVFLAPRDNVAEIRTASVPQDILVVPVDTLGDAVAALAALRAGEQPADAFELAADPALAGS